MKKTNKLLLAVLTLAMAIICFVGCAQTEPPQKAVVTFMAGQDIVATMTVNDQNKVFEPHVQTANGSYVQGWYTSADFAGTKFDFAAAVTENTTLYAKIENNLYTVTYDLGYETMGNPPTQASVNLDGSFNTAEAPTRRGYEFMGWTDGSKLYPAGEAYTVAATDNVVLVATWQYKEFQVQFVNAYGDVLKTQTVPYGGGATAPETPTNRYEAYEFAGWDTAFDAITADTVVTGSYNYVASDEALFRFTLTEDESGYEIAINEDVLYSGAVEIPTYLALPQTYEGKPVVAVAEEGFMYLDGITTIHVPSSIKTIKSCGFYQNHSLTTLVLEEGVERLETLAIASCYVLDGIELPSTLEHFGFNIFYRCYGLIDLSVAEGNPNFKYEDGFLKSKDGKRLYCAVYPVVGEFVTIGQEVEWIAPGLFCDDNILLSVTIDADLPYIGCGTFYQSGVQTITLNGVIGEVHGYSDVDTKYDDLISEREQYWMMSYGAFERAASLESITFKPGLKYVGCAFNGFTTVKKIELPDTVEEIVIDAFYAMNIESVRVVGTNTNARYYSDMDAAIIKRDATEGDTLLFFARMSPVKDYVIPATVRHINYHAFSETSNLESVVIPEGVTELPNGAFIQSAIQRVTIPSTVTKLTSGLPFFNEEYGMPSWARAMTEPTGPFQFCTSLTEVNYPNGNNLEYICDYAFNGTGLTSFTISKKLTYFGVDAVFGDRMEEWIVEEGCTLDYSAVDGVLYNKDGSVLISYPSAKKNTSFVVPGTVKTVKANVFAMQKYLETVTFEEGCEVLEVSAFSSLPNLKTITLPASLKTMYNRAIAECAALETVEFRGQNLPELYDEWGEGYFTFFTYTYISDDYSVYEERLPENLRIYVPAGRYMAYYQSVSSLLGMDTAARIDDSTETKVTYVFDSKGGSPVESVTAVVLTQLTKPTKDGSFFWGWYLTDGTQAGTEWGEEVKAPYIFAGGKTVTLYARWESEKKQDGLSWDTCYVIDGTRSFTITESGLYYFCYTPTATGKLVDGANSLPFMSEVLEALAMDYNNRVWAMLYTQPSTDYQYLISMDARYVTKGETIYITLEVIVTDENYPLTFDIDFEINET